MQSPEDELRQGVLDALNNLDKLRKHQKNWNSLLHRRIRTGTFYLQDQTLTEKDKMKVSKPKSAWVNSDIKRTPKSNAKHGTRKPSLRAMANESIRTRDQHEKCLCDLMTTIPAQADDVISQDHVDFTTLRSVVWLMRRSANKSQLKHFSEKED